MTYYCKRTGQTFATEAIAKSLVSNCDAETPKAVEQAPIAYLNSDGSIGMDSRARDAGGNLITNQEGSQFWMDAGYTGAEPPMEVKAIFSSAEYARDWAGEALRTIAAANPGVQLSDAMGNIVNYPVTTGTAEIWKAMPALNPANSVNYNTPSSSPGSTNEPAYIQKITTQASVGTEEVVNNVQKAIETAKGNLMYIVGGIVVVVLLVLMMSGKAKSGVMTS
jgi:hypothetical protein